MLEMLFKTISGREEYTDPGEKFENVTMLLYQPPSGAGSIPWAKLVNCQTGNELDEPEYFDMLRDIYNGRNPHAAIGEIQDD